MEVYFFKSLTNHFKNLRKSIKTNKRTQRLNWTTCPDAKKDQLKHYNYNSKSFYSRKPD